MTRIGVFSDDYLILWEKTRVAPDTELAGYPANFLPDIRYPAWYPARRISISAQRNRISGQIPEITRPDILCNPSQMKESEKAYKYVDIFDLSI